MGLLLIKQYFKINMTNNLQCVLYNTRGLEYSYCHAQTCCHCYIVGVRPLPLSVCMFVCVSSYMAMLCPEKTYLSSSVISVCLWLLEIHVWSVMILFISHLIIYCIHWDYLHNIQSRLLISFMSYEMHVFLYIRRSFIWLIVILFLRNLELGFGVWFSNSLFNLSWKGTWG